MFGNSILDARATNKGATRKYLLFRNYRARASNFRRGAAERNQRADKESERTFDPADERLVKWKLVTSRRPRLITVLWCSAAARRECNGLVRSLTAIRSVSEVTFCLGTALWRLSSSRSKLPPSPLATRHCRAAYRCAYARIANFEVARVYRDFNAIIVAVTHSRQGVRCAYRRHRCALADSCRSSDSKVLSLDILGRESARPFDAQRSGRFSLPEHEITIFGRGFALRATHKAPIESPAQSAASRPGFIIDSGERQHRTPDRRLR